MTKIQELRDGTNATCWRLAILDFVINPIPSQNRASAASPDTCNLKLHDMIVELFCDFCLHLVVYDRSKTLDHDLRKIRCFLITNYNTG